MACPSRKVGQVVDEHRFLPGRGNPRRAGSDYRVVTALPTEAGSFSSRGGLTRAEPGPGCDVACPVAVGVQFAVGGADDDVLMGTGAFDPTDVAVDRGGGGVHEDDSSSGALSLGDKDARERCPACVQDRPVQPGLGCNAAARELHGAGGRGGHGGHAELFEGKRVAGGDQRAGGLVVNVPPPVADLAPRFGEGPQESSAVAGTRSGASGAALQVSDWPLGGVDKRGLGTTSPSLVVRTRTTPTSTPTDRPVAGRGTASVSVTTTTYQRRLSRLSCSVLT